MKRSLTTRLRNKLDLLRYTSRRGWFVHARFWWYTSRKERLVVGVLLVLVSISVGLIAHYTQQLKLERQQLYCLAMNIYHEARGEPYAGKVAVAEVTLNRVNSKHYPNTICEVVHQKRWDEIRKRYVSAFSWTELDFAVNLNSHAWKDAMRIAQKAYAEELDSKVGDALFYHADYVKPSWSRKKKIKAKIGSHIFY